MPTRPSRWLAADLVGVHLVSALAVGLIAGSLFILLSRPAPKCACQGIPYHAAPMTMVEPAPTATAVELVESEPAAEPIVERAQPARRRVIRQAMVVASVAAEPDAGTRAGRLSVDDF
jgi:hypothetical protein